VRTSRFSARTDATSTSQSVATVRTFSRPPSPTAVPHPGR
jgi:hypothetical protein